jgi:hypothetical protein
MTTSYYEKHQEQVSKMLEEDLNKSEYRTAALTHIALARNSIGAPELSEAYSAIAQSYALLEQARWSGKEMNKK